LPPADIIPTHISRDLLKWASRADDRGVAMAEPMSCSTHWIYKSQLC